jgi:hypothetical protein
MGWSGRDGFPVLRVRAVALAVAMVTLAVACSDLTGPPIHIDAGPDADAPPMDAAGTDASGDPTADAEVESDAASNAAPDAAPDAASDAAPDDDDDAGINAGPDADADAGIDASVECASADECLGGSDCAVASCPAGRCVYAPENAQCDDDGDLCTFATCDPDLGCQTVLDDTADKALWDNGPLIIHEGAGPDGTHLSVVQNGLGLTTRGFTSALPGGAPTASR